MTDTIGKQDGLLNLARIVIIALLGFLAFIGGAMTFAIGATLTVGREALYAKLAAESVPPSGFYLVILAFALVLGAIVLGFIALRELLRIVSSVREGDPFHPINADRLRKMGWLTLAGQPLWWGAIGVARWLQTYSDTLRAGGEAAFTFHGLLLALVLFVLARVFRVGAEMRNELEGTV